MRDRNQYALTPQPILPGLTWVSVDVPTPAQLDAARALSTGFHLMVYVPTDLPVFKCPETGRAIQFAQQLEVLRRCQLRFGKVWAIGLYPSLIRDPLLYVESVSAHANYVFWTREVERDETEHRLDLEIQRLWHEVTQQR